MRGDGAVQHLGKRRGRLCLVRFYQDEIRFVVSEREGSAHNAEGNRIVERCSPLDGDFSSRNKAHFAYSASQLPADPNRLDNAGLVLFHLSKINYCHINIPQCFGDWSMVKNTVYTWLAVQCQ